MRALVQRVSRASVCIEQAETRSIGPGLLILLGVKQGDTPALCEKLAAKCAHLRIFEDEQGKMNRSAVELGHSVLVVSQFTLYANTKKGRRPSFDAAAKPPLSVQCYQAFVESMARQGLRQVHTGRFGAHMQVELVNDGPVTILLDTDEWLASI